MPRLIPPMYKFYDLMLAYLTNAMWRLQREVNISYVSCQVKDIFLTPVQSWMHNCIWKWTWKWDPDLMLSTVWPIQPSNMTCYSSCMIWSRGSAIIRSVGGGKNCDRVQASLRNKSSLWLDYIELRTRHNQSECLENMKTVYPDENNIVLNENNVDIKPCINR